MDTSYPPAEYSHLPSLDRRSLVMSTWNVLEQPPPPSLREILGAYRSKGDGDRDMLIAMLGAKSAEDQRIAAVASLHRTLLDLYTTDARIPLVTHLERYPQSSPHINSPKDKYRSVDLTNSHESAHRPAPYSREPPYQSQPLRKRQRYSRSPIPHKQHETRPAHPQSRDLPPSPYSSRSDSAEYSPRSRASMAIGSLLSSGAGRDPTPESFKNTPDVPQTRLPSSAIGVSV